MKNKRITRDDWDFIVHLLILGSFGFLSILVIGMLLYSAKIVTDKVMGSEKNYVSPLPDPEPRCKLLQSSTKTNLYCTYER